mmetsp:Transcript_48032/g.104468  ORF Transcript_48032/g.104468 Transcript_48032/m.104468 type:complete len:228 (+) Transcript_48032:1004-1687(+)
MQDVSVRCASDFADCCAITCPRPTRLSSAKCSPRARQIFAGSGKEGSPVAASHIDTEWRTGWFGEFADWFVRRSVAFDPGGADDLREALWACGRGSPGQFLRSSHDTLPSGRQGPAGAHPVPGPAVVRFVAARAEGGYATKFTPENRPVPRKCRRGVARSGRGYRHLRDDCAQIRQTHSCSSLDGCWPDVAVGADHRGQRRATELHGGDLRVDSTRARPHQDAQSAG